MGFLVILLVCLTVLTTAISSAGPFEHLKHKWDSDVDVSKKEICDFCLLLMPMVRNLVHKNKTSHLGDIATYLCNKRLKLADEIVCEMAIKEYMVEIRNLNPNLTSVLSVVKHSSLTSSELCALALDCSSIDNPILTWNISLPNVPKPPVKPFIPPKRDAKPFRILHLSDIHIDFEYEPGALAECDQPLCCRNESTAKPGGKGRKEPGPAGYWGDYRRCDIPLWTVENMFSNIARNEQFDVVYWTGDLPPHNIWNQTRGEQLSALRLLTQLFMRYFPGKLVLPSLGNHESQPCNLFPTPYVKDDSIEWLYTTLAQEWTKTGLPSSLYKNITIGAFYSIKLLPKLRLISLNTNYCPKENFWLIINSTDPLGQLQWLADTLQESENNGEKVHIIGHIDPSKCLNSWSRNYYAIVNRYESTITGQFFGHTHKDEIKIFYDMVNTSRPVGVAYIAPSVTTESYLNPSYRIYSLDGLDEDATMQLVDYETIVMNLTQANELGTPKWVREYSAKDAFDLSDLSPAQWSERVDDMLRDLWGELANRAIRFYAKSSEFFPKCDDIKCRKELICGFKKARSDDLVC